MAVLQPVFEAEDAMMLMDYLHTDVATKADIARLEDRMGEREDHVDARFDRLESRFDGLESRFDGFESRFEGLESRFDGLEQSVETQITSAKHEMLAAFRGELIDAVSGQTRALIFTSAASVASMGGIAVALARFA
jgi:archaellum component FlaC